MQLLREPRLKTAFPIVRRSAEVSPHTALTKPSHQCRQSNNSRLCNSRAVMCMSEFWCINESNGLHEGCAGCISLVCNSFGGVRDHVCSRGLVYVSYMHIIAQHYPPDLIKKWGSHAAAAQCCIHSTCTVISLVGSVER